jgi:hypothetical protein
VFFTAVVTRVNVIPLASAVSVGAAVVVPGADTNTASNESAVGVNDPDVYDESLVVVPVVSRCDHAATEPPGTYSVRLENPWDLGGGQVDVQDAARR